MCRISIPGTVVRFCVGLFALYTAMGSSMPQAAAQTPIIWQGPTSDFEAGTNWDLGIPPANDLTTHLATFNALESWQNPALTAGRELYGLSFTEGGWTLGGSYMLTVGAGGVSCSASSGVVAVNASIAGTGGVAKSGASTLSLAGANAYTGNTVLNAGILRAEGSNPGTLGAGASQLILNGGTLESYADTASTINYGRNVVVNGNTTITVGRLTSGDDRTAAPRQFGTLSIGNATLAAKLDLTTYTGAQVDASLTFGDTTLTGNANFNLTDLRKSDAWSSFATLNLGNLTDGGNGHGFTATGSWYYSTLVANGGVNVSGNVQLNGTTLRAVGDWSTQYFGGNINLAGGVLQLSGELTRPLGAGDGQIRLTSGSAGFSTYNGGSNVTVNLTDPSTGQSASLVWGSANFNPSALMLALGSAASSGQLELVNSIDLNGSTRTFNLYGGVGKISGVLGNSGSSSAGLIKHTNGGGTLWLANDGNTFDGPIQVLNATLQFESVGNVGGGPSSLGAPTTAPNGLISLGSAARSAVLRHTGGSDSSTNRMISLPGTTGLIAITADGAGTIRFTNTGPMPTPGAGAKTLTFNGTNTGENLFAIGIIDNSSTNTTSVAKSGAGTWVLSGANTYTGATTVSGGTLIATKPAALPGYDSTGKVSVTASGATLAVRAGGAGEWTSPAVTTLLANATFAAGSNLGIDVTAGNAFEHAEAIGGSRGLVKLGGGTLTLSGANTYTGNTAVREGTLQLGASNVLSQANLTVAGGATLDMQGFNQNVNALYLQDGTIDGAGTLSLGSRSYLTKGVINANLSGNLGTGDLDRIEIGGDPTATVELNGNNTFTASHWGILIGHPPTAGGNAGIVKLGHPNALGTAGRTSLYTGALDLNGLANVAANYIMLRSNAASLVNNNTGSTASTAAQVLVRGGTAGNPSTDCEIGGPGNLVLSGQLTDGGNNNGFRKIGTGTLTLTGNSIYTGTTTISEGILQLGNGGTSGSLSPSSAINNQAVLAFNRSDTLTQGTHFASVIGGSGEVRKLGSGTVILGGNNNYSGPTTVTAGRLLVHGTHTGGGDYTVNSGATLGGTGSIGANIGIHSGGRLAPGASIGRLTIGGDLTLADGAEWDWEFFDNDSPDNYDQVAGPTLILPSDGTSTIALNILGMPGHSVNWYDEFVLFTGSVENFDAGMFDLVNNSSWSRGWSISVGNSLVLTAVPEPGTWLMLVCSLALGLLARRRR